MRSEVLASLLHLGEAGDVGDFLAAFIEHAEDVVVGERGDFTGLGLIGDVFQFKGDGDGFTGAEGLFRRGEARAHAVLRITPLGELGRGRARGGVVFPNLPMAAEPSQKQVHVLRGVAFEKLSERIHPLEHVQIALLT